jgi:glutamine amidotransferase
VCRHLAYLGPPRALSALLFEPPHGLDRQSWAPADMRGGGTINADGFGVGWYPPPGAPPVRYRNDRPLWSDESFAGLAAVTTAGAMLAAVRSATAGMSVVRTACRPFTDGHRLFSHNGRVTGWPGSMATLAAALPVTDLITLDAPTDSALLWALVRHRLRTGEPPADALAAVVGEVVVAAPGSRLNLLLTDGERVHATAWGHALSVRAEAGAVTVASEPSDPLPGWTQVPEGAVLTATPGRAETQPITADRTGAR